MEAREAEVVVCFSDGPPDAPNTFFFSITGVVQEVADGWVEIMGDRGLCKVRLDVSDTRFEYVEAIDRRLEIEDDERKLAERLFEGNLSMAWAHENFCVFTVLREGVGIDSE